MTIDNIKLLIADNKIEQATSELLQLAKKDAQLLNQVILLKNQFKDYTQNVNLNLVERNEERAKVVNGLLYIADEIGKNINQNDADTEGCVMRGSSEILSVLWLNLYGNLTKNLDIVLESIHPQSPIYNQMAEYTKQVYLFDLIYNLVSLEVLEQNNNQARVKMVLETRSRQPVANFKNNIWISIQYLMLDENNHWKIWSGDTLEFKYIE